ncbi:MAG TPA: formyltransferase family protein [Chthonomonadales bacterium]|nr:formyltransferase family protein [Chthonomonadales bacterium]
MNTRSIFIDNEQRPLRIGIVGSSGGSVFAETRQILEASGSGRYEYVVATDRPCGLEELCAQCALPHRRIEQGHNADFSCVARRFFAEQGGVDFVLLFFLRLVTEELFETYPTFNIHPSLLPAFRGLQPLKKALQERVRFLGATLHLVTADVDAGPIVAQTVMPIRTGETQERLGKYSFIQKVYLSLLLVELIERDALRLTERNRDVCLADLPFTDRCNPALQRPEWVEGVLRLQEREGVEVIRV